MVHHGPPMQLLFFVQHLQSLLQQTQGAGEPQKSLPLHSHENVGRWKLTFQVAKSICAQIRTNSYTMLHHEKETEILKVWNFQEQIKPKWNPEKMQREFAETPMAALPSTMALA